jgi:tetratricopeptide (TPR) repeat protein
MPELEPASSVASFSKTNPKSLARLRPLLVIGVVLIVAAFAYNRYDASRPTPPKPVAVAAPDPPVNVTPAPAPPAPRPDLTAAIAELRAKVQKDPKDVQSRYRLASLLDQQGNGSDAEDVIREALRQGQRHPDLFFALGQVYLHNDQYRPAALAFQEVVKSRPKNAEAHSKLGNAYSYAGNPRGAEKAFLTARKLDPSLPDPYLGLAFLNNTSDRYPHAVRYIQDYIKRTKEPGPGYGLLCRVYINMNAFDKAVEAGMKAIRLMPDNPNMWYTLGQAYFYQPSGKNLDRAASAFAEALKRNRDFGHAHFELASVLSRMGKIQESVGEYREAARCEPWQGRYHYQLGVALQKIGAIEESKQAKEKSKQLIPLNQQETKLLDKITVSPQNPELSFALAQVYRQLGRYEYAKIWYQTTLDLVPNHPQARRELEAVTQLARPSVTP